jgi:hypothetical protein
MICFAKNYDYSSNKKSKSLQMLLDSLYNELDLAEGEEFKHSDLSELLEIAYNALFIQNKNLCQITINKNPNNSLDITIDKIK